VEVPISIANWGISEPADRGVEVPPNPKNPVVLLKNTLAEALREAAVLN
jgi:hypothetical protein